MRIRSLLPSDSLGSLCFVTGILVLILLAGLTLVAVGVAATGPVAQVEHSQIINRSYAALLACGEAFALVGLGAGMVSLIRCRKSLALAVGLILNFIGLVVFLP